MEAIFKQFEVATTAVATLLVLDLVLHNERLLAEVDGLLKGSRDGVVSSLVLGNEALVALNERGLGILDLPLADVAEGLAANGGLLGGL